MKIEILFRGIYRKQGSVAIDLPTGSTCADALKAVGIDWEADQSFGFASVNGRRVMIDTTLNDGDQLKAFSKIGGG
jgi:sulfur carrier protein ThiS